MLIIKRDTFVNVVKFKNIESNVDKLCAILLAITPILQHYRGIIINAGITILVIITPWLLIKFLRKRLKISYHAFGIIISIVIFNVYKTFVHEINILGIFYMFIMIIIFLAASMNFIDIKYFIKTSYFVASIASSFIIIQVMCYYLLKFHLQLVPISLLLSESSQWILGVKTGRIDITGVMGMFYRPSAFFLEPSHMFLYIFPLLFLNLLKKNANVTNKKRAILFSIGIVLTTSGMGVITVASIWLVYFVLLDEKKEKMSLFNILKAKNLIYLMICIIGFIILYLTVPFIQGSIMRIIDNSNRGAIAGRSRLAKQLIGTLSGKQFIFGVTSSTKGIKFNMPGFEATLYKFGIIGIILTYRVYLYALFKLKGAYSWIALFIILISFSSAHTHGTFYMIYYIFILLNRIDSYK